MAEQVPYGVAANFIHKLASASLHEFGQIYGVTNELEDLKNTIESIHAVLLDADEKQEQDYAVQIWIRRLKEVLLHADDLIDDLIVENMRQKVEAFHSFSSSNRISLPIQMADEIKRTQETLNDVLQEISKLNLSQRAVVSKQFDSVRRETSSFVLESDIIGREDGKKKIISLLKQPNKKQNVSCIAIVGIGGLGKTALAQLVYNDVEVQKIFEKHMWVCVSDNFDIKTIVKKMLESLTGVQSDEKLSLDNLQSKLRKKLRGKKYLIVLDDIWNENHTKWADLRTYLMCGTQDSKILVTTRSEVVARKMGVSDPYVLNGLTTEESWCLLKNIAFEDDTMGVNQTLELIGKKIAEKCGGVPLAIKTLGGLLQGKREEGEWINVLHGDFWKLCKDEDSIMPVLKLSYQNLSPQLRQCFSYCSLYPKDWEIEKDELIQLWMAHGFLECSTENEHMEDIGNQFVELFLMKSFFQDAKVNKQGEILSFKMHDLIHDLAMLVAGNDCCHLDNKGKGLVRRPMHVSLEPNAICLLDSLDASRLRTLILRSYNGEDLSVISKFEYLRVLTLSSNSITELPDSIGNFDHLRYLNLSNCRLTSLPKFIGNLVCLQTLILNSCAKLEFYTAVVTKLINLRHLDISKCRAFEHGMPFGLGKLSIGGYPGLAFPNWLSSLQNIVEISLRECSNCRHLSPLEHLLCLKSLEIRFLGELEYIYFTEDFSKTFFPSLECLHLIDCPKFKGWCKKVDDANDTKQSLHYHSLPPFPCLSQLEIRACPQLIWMPTFPKLVKELLLESCSLEPLKETLNMASSLCLVDSFTPLSMLKCLHIYGDLNMTSIPNNWMQNLTSLEQLIFGWSQSKTFQEFEIWFKDDLNYLPYLQKISVQFCKNLEALPDWMCNLSSLKHITIWSCPKLVSLPEGMPRLSNLQTVEIIGCPFLHQNFKGGRSATWPNIACIPKIILK
ncbi:putative disease resistance protein RGA1 [Abrus precatorius]|uniref:Disease resistance protein RGA1 n=1 Tax=Abrus precatorius TaxID=3816 RepID=A0A8B8KX13_ABRPR|nr:putative disease resistance protein RGA1 [Abrus precatorius]